MRIVRSVSDRAGMLGGSDSAAALGFSPFKTRSELWLEKTGRLEPKSLDDVEAVRFGSLFEDVVANEFALRLGLKLRRENLMTVHTAYPFIGGHIDRRVVAQPCGVEIKTTSEGAFKTLWGEPGSDQAPDFVLSQIHTYFELWPDFEFFFVPVLVGGQRLVVFEVERDDEISHGVVEGMVAFWQEYVLPDVPPPIEAEINHPSMLPLLKRLHPGTDGSTRHLDPKVRPYVETMLAEQEVRKQADAVIDTCKARILAAMEDAAVGVVEGIGEVHRKVVKRRGFTVEPTEYIDMRIKQPKEPA